MWYWVWGLLLVAVISAIVGYSADPGMGIASARAVAFYAAVAFVVVLLVGMAHRHRYTAVLSRWRHA